MREIKLFGVDLSIKYIFLEIDGEEYTIQFRDNWLKGVYDIKILKNHQMAKAKVVGSYPPIIEIMKELRQVWFPVWVKKIKVWKR